MNNSYGKGVQVGSTGTGGTPIRAASAMKPKAQSAPHGMGSGSASIVRVPAGQPGGGEFAPKDGGGGGGSSSGNLSVAERTARNLISSQGTPAQKIAQIARDNRARQKNGGVSFGSPAAATLRKQIDALPPGGTVHIRSSHGESTHAERSGDGRTIRYVRTTPSGSEVYKTESVKRYTVEKPGERPSFEHVMSMISNVPGGYRVEGRGGTFVRPERAQEEARKVIAEQKAKARTGVSMSPGSIQPHRPHTAARGVGSDPGDGGAGGSESGGGGGGGGGGRAQRLASQLRTAANDAVINLSTFEQTPARIANNFSATPAEAKQALEILRKEGTLKVKDGVYIHAKR